jgi:hypothetical protein
VGLWSAAPFLIRASLRNRVLAQWRRLKNPKYLVATAAGLFYFWSVFARRWFFSGSSMFRANGLPPEALVAIEAFMILGALVVITGTWVLGSSRSALRYSDSLL